jgi:hypothetical protein
VTATIDHLNGSVYESRTLQPYTPSYTEQSANAEAIRLKAAAEAEAIRLKAGADDAGRAVANSVKAAKAAAEVAEHQAQAEEIRREAAEKAAAARRVAQEQAAAEAARAAEQWHRDQVVALAEKRARQMVTVSVLIALPIQLVAFWKMSPALVVVPLGLEYAAWVMLAQVDAAVAEKRRTGHFIAATLIVAAFAATMNWMHGPDLLQQGGQLVGAAGAFFSLLGPLTWALHTHGKVAKKAGRPSRKQLRAERQAAQVAARDAEERRQAVEADAEELDARRFEQHPEVYARAAYIASATGALGISEEVWLRAWHDVKGEGVPVGETAESIAARKAANELVRTALAGDTTPLPVLLQDGRIRAYKQPAILQVSDQVPPAPKRVTERVRPTPPKRRKGDTPPFSAAARKVASLTAKKAAQK